MTERIEPAWRELMELLEPIHRDALASARGIARSNADGDDLYQGGGRRRWTSGPARTGRRGSTGERRRARGPRAGHRGESRLLLDVESGDEEGLNLAIDVVGGDEIALTIVTAPSPVP